jgi:hypothetical protein
MLTHELLGGTGSNMVMGDYDEGEGTPDGANIYAGGAPGVSAIVVLKPDTREIDVVLSNVDSLVTDEIAALLESAR